MSRRRDGERYDRRHALTPGETEVLSLVALGYAYADVGARLCITEEGVRTHVGNLLRTFGLRNRTHLALAAVVLGIVSRDAMIRALDEHHERTVR